MLEAGIEGYQEIVVSKEDTALAVGSGGLLVLATPVIQTERFQIKVDGKKVTGKE